MKYTPMQMKQHTKDLDGNEVNYNIFGGDMKTLFWYMMQPIKCQFGFHDWYRGERSGNRICEYCDRHEVLDMIDADGRVHWRLK